MVATGHEACFVCRERNWFAPRPAAGPEKITAGLTFDLEHEGWQGIPHGGTAMSALLDFADHARLARRGENLAYPLAAAFRFGDSVRIGDRMALEAVEKDGKLGLQMFREGAEKIYLAAEVEPGAAPGRVAFAHPDPDRLLAAGPRHHPLEVYDNCFVCGRKRQAPGLERRFFRSGGEFEPAVVMVRFGDVRDRSRGLARNFQQAAGRLHPGILATLLDELLGWSGVLSGDLYGFTVRFRLVVNFLPGVDDELFGISPAPPVRGRGERRFYYPKGVLYRRSGEGGFTAAAVAEGQWLARDELRRQFVETRVSEDLSGVTF
jgi:acyl-coenzyme A thioesterase PaaI-like protein